MLSESAEPNLTTSVPSFSPTRYFDQPSFNTRPFSNLEPGVRHREEWRSFPPFFSFFFSRDAEERRIVSTQRRVK
jgi:hypothetical protein